MVHAPLILSKSAFAARHGVGISAVSNWIARGIISGGALTADRRINVEAADRQLAANLDTSRSLGKLAAQDDAALPFEASAPPVRTAAPVSELAAIKLEQARRQLQRDRENDLARQGLYVEAAAVRKAHARELNQFVATVEQRLPELVGLIEGQRGKAGLVIARRWWRGLRQSEADSAVARAAALPEFATEVSHAA